MALLDFPNAPVIDEHWTSPIGTVYRWDGVVWASVGGGGGSGGGGGGTLPPDASAQFVDAAGDTMSGPLDMSGNRVNNAIIDNGGY